MSAPILIATGSTAGGILQDFQRRRLECLELVPGEHLAEPRLLLVSYVLAE